MLATRKSILQSPTCTEEKKQKKTTRRQSAQPLSSYKVTANFLSSFESFFRNEKLS